MLNILIVFMSVNLNVSMASKSIYYFFFFPFSPIFGDHREVGVIFNTYVDSFDHLIIWFGFYIHFVLLLFFINICWLSDFIFYLFLPQIEDPYQNHEP